MTRAGGGDTANRPGRSPNLAGTGPRLLGESSVLRVQRPRRTFDGAVRVGEDLAQVGLDAAAGVPVLGVAQGALLAADAIPVVGGADVEMAVDDGLGAVAQM